MHLTTHSRGTSLAAPNPPLNSDVSAPFGFVNFYWPFPCFFNARALGKKAWLRHPVRCSFTVVISESSKAADRASSAGAHREQVITRLRNCRHKPVIPYSALTGCLR